MQVLLKEAVPHLGDVGELVDVKPGYARNYLVPQDKATPVTHKNAKAIESEMLLIRKREDKRRELLRLEAQKLADARCTISAKADANDKLYGSVTPSEISKSLHNLGFNINPKSIQIKEPIRSVGVHTVELMLDKGIATELEVWVVGE